MRELVVRLKEFVEGMATVVMESDESSTFVSTGLLLSVLLLVLLLRRRS